MMEQRGEDMERERVINILADVRERVWMHDIPHPAMPAFQYVELHSKMVDIMAYIDSIIESLEGEKKK